MGGESDRDVAGRQEGTTVQKQTVCDAEAFTVETLVVLVIFLFPARERKTVQRWCPSDGRL